MKNFYEVTVIDIKNQLEVVVELREHDNPEYKFTVNDLPMVSRMPFAFCLLAELQFRCTISNGAVEVAKITIEGNEYLIDSKYNVYDVKTQDAIGTYNNNILVLQIFSEVSSLYVFV